MKIADLVPDQAEVEAMRRGKPIPKGSSRLEEKQTAQRRTVVNERAFLKTVRERDRMRCRCCGRKVVVTLERLKDRCEVHHLHGRAGVLRFEDRAALVLCLACHEPVTGRVNRKVIVVGTAFFEVQTKRGVLTCIDARQPVRFEEVAA